MRLLFDTNILIYIEDPKELSPDLQELLALIRSNGHQVLIHPVSLKEISRDENQERRKITLSKLKGYPVLPEQKMDSEFEAKIGTPTNEHDLGDNTILFSLAKNNVDFLITEDQGLYKKAGILSLEDRALSIRGALKFFKALHTRVQPKSDVLRYGPMSNLNIKDKFFDPLRADYGESEFEKWFETKSREGRESWDYSDPDGSLGAVMILKEENDTISTSPPLPKMNRLKICTLKVVLLGMKIGESFLQIAFDYCVKNNIYEAYLTHFVIPNDPLIHLIEDFGFVHDGHLQRKNPKGEFEQVYVKRFIPSEEDKRELHAFAFSRKYCPAYKDGQCIRKFLIPIKPEYHNRLFPRYKREQKSLSDYLPTPFGNAIKKAYLSNSGIRRLAPGDVVIFYRSDDEQTVGCLGIVEKILISKNADEITRFVGKRTVYSEAEIRALAAKSDPVLAILFRYHFELPVKLGLEQLQKLGIIKSAPQSIVEINIKQYNELKKGCKIDEHLAVS